MEGARGAASINSGKMEAKNVTSFPTAAAAAAASSHVLSHSLSPPPLPLTHSLSHSLHLTLFLSLSLFEASTLRLSYSIFFSTRFDLGEDSI